MTIKCYINHPNKVFWHNIEMLLISLMCHTPIVIRATRALFQRFDNKIYPWNRGRHVRLMPIGASACPMVAFSGFYESQEPPPSGNVHSIVPLLHNDHRNGRQSAYILHNCCVDCRPGGRRGNTEWVVAQWRHSVASGEALFVLHWEMCSVLHRRTAMTINMARDGGTFVHHRRLYWLL